MLFAKQSCYSDLRTRDWYSYESAIADIASNITPVTATGFSFGNESVPLDPPSSLNEKGPIR